MEPHVRRDRDFESEGDPEPCPGQFHWETPPLDPQDQRLVDAYLKVGRPLDQLAYTEDFEKLIELVRSERTDEVRRQVFQRLLRLRKMGRLPRLGYMVEESTGL